MDEWRSVRGWHVVFALLAVTTAASLIPDWVSLAVLGALCAWYAGTGVRAMRNERGLLYILGAAPLTVTLYGLNPIGSIMLFALYPQMWALLPTRQAIAGTAVVIAAITTLGAGGTGFGLVFGGVTLVVSLALGLWITRIIEQSRNRAALVVQERQRLAREIHDTLAQGFAAMLLQLEAIEADIGENDHITKARRVAKDNLAEARALVDALAPPDLRASSLPDALKRLATAENACFALTGRPKALPATQEVMLLRAVQEALANVGKHAQATKTEVKLHYGDTIHLQVTDDGIGFDPVRAKGFGLTAMRSRAQETGALLTIDSAPGSGTKLSLEIPA